MTLYQTTRMGSVSEAIIPFDIQLFVSEVLKNPDSLIHNLSFDRPSDVPGFEHVVGQSSAIKEAVERAKRAAIRQYNVLLIGESGTGKELFANAIHRVSLRSSGPFVPKNCAAIPENLLEPELFGHAKGAFTGADRDKPGAFGGGDKGDAVPGRDRGVRDHLAGEAPSRPSTTTRKRAVSPRIREGGRDEGPGK